MPTLSPQAQAVVTAFGHQPGVSADQVTNLQAVINGSPALVDQINAAVQAGQLQRIQSVAPGTGWIGSNEASGLLKQLPEAQQRKTGRFICRTWLT